MFVLFFFFNDTATTEIYTLSLHDALPISPPYRAPAQSGHRAVRAGADPDHPAQGEGAPAVRGAAHHPGQARGRSEEHTSELQSRPHLVCRLLLEKKKTNAPEAAPDPSCNP